MADQEAPIQSAPQRRVTQDLTTGPVAKTLLVFALPALIVNIVQQLNGTIASAFISQILGKKEFAAVSIANNIMFLVFSVVIGFAMAATIMAGQAMGRKDIVEVRRVTGVSIGLFVIGGAVMAILGWIATPFILRLLATPIGIFDIANAYVRAIMLILPVSVINALLPSLLRGVGDAVSPLRAMVVNLAVTVIACPIFINLLGISGAAVAGLLANLASVIYQIHHVYRVDLPVRLRGEELRLLRPDWARVAPLFKLGLPMGLSMFLMGASQMAMFGIINRKGEDAVAAFGAAMNIWGYLQMPAYAVSMAVSAMAAQNIGAGKWDRIDRIAGVGIVTNFAMTGILVALITLFQMPLLSVFLPLGSDAIIMAAHICLLLNWTHIIMGVSSIVTSMVRSNGAVVMPLIMLFTTAVVMRGIIGFGGYPYWGLDAVWAAFIVHAVTATLWSLGYYRWGKWREMKVDTGENQAVGLEASV